MITEEQHKLALATAQAPMFASKSSNVAVVMPEDVDSVNPARYHTFLGVKEDQGEKAVSMGIPAQPPQGLAATKMTYVPATNGTAKGDINANCDPTRLCEAFDTVLKAMRTWHMTVTLTITDMQMVDCIVWDAKHKAIDEATLKFSQVCKASHITGIRQWWKATLKIP